MKGNEEMIRIVAIAAAFLIMFGIIGIAIYSINSIDDANQKHQEREEGKNIAASIIQTTATTSVWDYIRASSEAAATTVPVYQEPVPSNDSNAEIQSVPASGAQTVTTTVPVIEGAA